MWRTGRRARWPRTPECRAAGGRAQVGLREAPATSPGVTGAVTTVFSSLRGKRLLGPPRGTAARLGFLQELQSQNLGGPNTVFPSPRVPPGSSSSLGQVRASRRPGAGTQANASMVKGRTPWGNGVMRTRESRRRGDPGPSLGEKHREAPWCRELRGGGRLAAKTPQVVRREGAAWLCGELAFPAKGNNDCLVQTVPLLGKCAQPFCLDATARCCRLSSRAPSYFTP